MLWNSLQCIDDSCQIGIPAAIADSFSVIPENLTELHLSIKFSDFQIFSTKAYYAALLRSQSSTGPLA